MLVQTTPGTRARVIISLGVAGDASRICDSECLSGNHGPSLRPASDERSRCTPATAWGKPLLITTTDVQRMAVASGVVEVSFTQVNRLFCRHIWDQAQSALTGPHSATACCVASPRPCGTKPVARRKCANCAKTLCQLVAGRSERHEPGARARAVALAALLFCELRTCGSPRLQNCAGCQLNAPGPAPRSRTPGDILCRLDPA